MKRKVRKDFDPTKEYRVNVKGCTKKEKKEVQQAFFDAGFPWESSGKKFLFLDAAVYTNTMYDGQVTAYCMCGSIVARCNMTAEEFLNLVYVPEHQGHVHAELMAQYAEDAKTSNTPWELWQVKFESGDWSDCQFQPMWDATAEFRRKQKTKLIHGVEVPDLSFTPKDGEYYYYICLSSNQLVGEDYHSKGCASTKIRSIRGLCYPHTGEGKQAAILHAEAMLNIA